MTTADWALGISIFSAMVACLSLGWNIYKEVALRARIKVSIGVGRFYSEGSAPSDEHVLLEATNFGPGKVKLESVRLQKRSMWSRLFFRPAQNAFVIHDYKNPLSSKLPIVLDVGERVTYPFTLDEDCFLKDDYTHVGIRDSFERIHWVPKGEFRKAKARWKNKFVKVGV